MKRNATKDATRKGHRRTPADPGCCMPRSLQRTDASGQDCRGDRQIEDHGVALDQESQGQSPASEAGDLGERFGISMSAWQTDRTGYGGFVHRMLGNRNPEPSRSTMGPNQPSSGSRHGPECRRDSSLSAAERGREIPSQDQSPEALATLSSALVYGVILLFIAVAALEFFK
jgi:hypothetical protein